MDMLIVTTESHRRLAESYFRPTLPADAGAVVLERQLDAAGGQYGTVSWQQGVSAKLGWALDHMATLEPGTAFVLSDVDIQFFPGFSTKALQELVDQQDVDVLFQKERHDPGDLEVNTGFYIARNTPWFRELLEATARHCATLEVKNDQTAMNATLQPDDLGTHWGFLPTDYYARSQGFPPARDIVLHHANFGGTLDQKSSALRRVRTYITGGPSGRLRATVAEAWDYVRTGKLRLQVRNWVDAHDGPVVTRVASATRSVARRVRRPRQA